MLKNDIAEVVILENTRPLYTVVEKLHSQFLAEQGGCETDESEQKSDESERVEKIREFCWNQIKELLAIRTEDDHHKKNHPYYFFVEFLKKESKMEKDLDKAVKKTVGDLVCLYDALYHLSKESLDRVRYPDGFERLCNCMCDTMDSSVCYLLYSQRNHIELLSTSVFPDEMVIGEESSGQQRQSDGMRVHEKKVPRQLTLNDFNEIRRRIHRARADKTGEDINMAWSIADTVYHPVVRDHHLVVLVIDFPRYPKETWKDEYLYIVFQKAETFPGPCGEVRGNNEDLKDGRRAWIKLIKQLRNVLFARNQILEQCVSKLYILMSSQRSYQYVKRLTDERGPLRILHLTDLHISENVAKQMDKFLRILEERDLNVDLLAITGDVIQASNSAGTMEERYQQAARFIRQIATKLWANNNHVRTDWRKRIIIVPGNHDYATMNELQSMSLPGEIRSTGLGYPARKEGGPMVKFTYYIKFLCDLLGMDINEMVINDLNDARRYQRMGLTVYALNTVSEIGPLRNNKVSVDLEAVNRLVKAREGGNRFNLILSHHSPFYEPNYLMDRYGNWSINVDAKKQQGWINRFAEALEFYDASQKTDTERNMCKNELNRIKDEIVLALVDPKSTYDLLWDISGAASTLEEDMGFNERVSLLHHTITRDKKMMQRDKRLLDNAFRELMWKIGFHMCLSGHTHQYQYHYYTDPFGVPSPQKQTEERDKTKILCVEGDQMFSGECITYGVVEVDMYTSTKRNVVWKGYSDENENPRFSLRSEF